MKCKSCNEDVPPKFTHALAVNICPLCGKDIMDIKLKNILGELKIAFDESKEYMDAVEDWLFSNYSLKKVKSNEIIIDKNHLSTIDTNHIAADTRNNFEKSSPQPSVHHNPGVMVNRKDEARAELNDDIVVDEISEKPSTVFAKRAGVIHPKNALDFIKGRSSVGAADPSEFQGTDEEYGDMEETDDNLNPLNASEKNQMAGLFKSADLGSGSRELELQKLKRLQAQSSVAGGGGGFFRRG